MDSENNSNFLSKNKKNPIQDLEIKDANIIFNSIWEEIASEVNGEENLKFSKEIFWLNGAPGAGKGTHTKFIIKYKDLCEYPIVVSELLKSKEACKRIDNGILVGDKEVTGLILRKLLNPIYENGAIVDGYPRTMVQVQCLQLLHNKLESLRLKKLAIFEKTEIKIPHFHIIVLFIDEEESIKRQLKRGYIAKEYNNKIISSGMGELIKIRKTDMNPLSAKNRYRTFKEITYGSLKSLQKVFHYHYINAHGSIKEIQERIIEELKYQSSLELSQKTFDSLTAIPIATDIIKYARQKLVKRLDNYQINNKNLFDKVIEYIRIKFIPIIKHHAISGFVSINIEDELFNDPLVILMLIDILSERGYYASINIEYKYIPFKMNLKDEKIFSLTKKIYKVNIKFEGSTLRRGQ